MKSERQRTRPITTSGIRTGAAGDRVPRSAVQPSRNLRICVVAPSLDSYGGQSIQAARLIEGLNQEPGFEAELLPINPRLPGALRHLQRIKYVRTVVTEGLYLILLLIRLARFDVIHVFSASYFSFLLAPTPALLIAKLFGRPVLLNYHSGEAEDHLQRWRRTALPVIKLADRVVVPSGFLKVVFARFGIQAEAISNTVELDQFIFRERRPLLPVLFSNRNHESHYKVDDTIRAFALIGKQVPEARLIVAGHGSQTEFLKQLTMEMGLTQVEFLGAVHPSQMPALYDAADIFINASIIDNMPLSIIEAFACGLPVVTTGAGGITYMVDGDRTGKIVKPGDYRALAEAVLSLLDDQSSTQKLITNARQEGESYTWKAVKSVWLTAYQDLRHRIS